MTKLARSTILASVSIVCLLVVIWAVCGSGPQIVGGSDIECTLDSHTIKTVVIVASIVGTISGLISNFQNREMLREARNRIGVLEIQHERALCQLRDRTVHAK